MAINQITTMRLPNGKEVAFVDWIDQPLYSTCDLLAEFTDSEIPLFNYGQGDEVSATGNATAVRTATEADTNLTSPSEMNSTEEMLIYAIRPEITEFRTADATPTDLTSILGQGGLQSSGSPMPSLARLQVLNFYLRFELEVSEEVLHTAGLGYYNSGMGPHGQGIFAGAANAVARSTGTPGLPSQEAVRSFAIPISIGGQEKFAARLKADRDSAVPSGITDADVPTFDAQIVHSIRVHFDGLYKRPVS